MPVDIAQTERLKKAIAHHRAGMLKEAEALYREVLRHRPGEPEALNLLGVVQYQSGRHEEAIKSLQRAVGRRSDKAEYYSNLSLPLREVGRNDEALKAADEAIRLRPDYVEALSNRGLVLMRLERGEAAVETFKAAITLKPDMPGLHNNLGNAYRQLKQYDKAVEAYREAIRLRPKHAHALFGLGVALDELGKREEAARVLYDALALDDRFAEAHRRLGMIWSQSGLPSEAIHHLLRAVEIDPDDHTAFGSAIFARNYLDGYTAEDFLRLAREYDERIRIKNWELQSFGNDPDPERTITVAFVSADLGNHPVGKFTQSVIEHLDRSRIRLHVYATKKRDEDMRALFDRWIEADQLKLPGFVKTVRADAPDILVDLAGFTAGNRLQAFVLRCAPVQASWLGYSGTTGVREMDYIIADRHIIPPGDERLYAETPWRLPDSYLCWTPPAESVEIGPLPALGNGHVTFGCFNNLRKISDQTIATWVKVIQAVPNSRLLLKSIMADPIAFRRLRDQLLEAGLTKEQFRIMRTAQTMSEAYGHSNLVDIALDPFPYNGTTTTVEALWMGVPVLTLSGDRFIARVGDSIMQAVGHPEWIAADTDDYVRKAAEFAADLPALAALRERLRGELLASPLCDAPRFARNLEAAFRGMWRAWCEKQMATSA